MRAKLILWKISRGKCKAKGNLPLCLAAALISARHKTKKKVRCSTTASALNPYLNVIYIYTQAVSLAVCLCVCVCLSASVLSLFLSLRALSLFLSLPLSLALRRVQNAQRARLSIVKYA